VTNLKKNDKRLENIPEEMVNQLADSVLELSDEEIFAEERASGADAAYEADYVRSVLRSWKELQRPSQFSQTGGKSSVPVDRSWSIDDTRTNATPQVRPQAVVVSAAADEQLMENLQTFERTEYQKIKAELHRKILDRLDLQKLGRTNSDTARDEVLILIRGAVNAEAVPLSFTERERLAREILDEIFGLGPLEPLLKDHSVSDILVNRFDRVYVERAGKLELTGLSFKDNPHLMQIIDRIVSRVGRRVDESSPMVDARLTDGSRVNAIIPPLAIDGACLSIRRFGRDPITARQMIENRSITEPMLELLSAMVKGRLNLIVSGGTGAGKTTLLNVLSGYIPNSERIVTIEDAAELQLKQQHVVRLETRPPNIEGKGAVRQRQLVINSLRMRPDRIVVGEVRGEEAFDMLNAMNTGHEGSLTTVHANTPRDALARLENMLSMANLNLPERAMRQQIASAIHAVVQVSRLADGTRKVITISEIVGMEGDMITMQDIFVFERQGIDENGKVRGQFRASGIQPQFAERLATTGCRLRPALFESRVEL
jgi:pilus assembly protein CpaF